MDVEWEEVESRGCLGFLGRAEWTAVDLDGMRRSEFGDGPKHSVLDTFLEYCGHLLTGCHVELEAKCIGQKLRWEVGVGHDHLGESFEMRLKDY